MYRERFPAAAREARRTIACPSGDLLEHAVVQFVTAAGGTLEARGVLPDQLVALSRQRLIAGEDAVLLAAQK